MTETAERPPLTRREKIAAAVRFTLVFAVVVFVAFSVVHNEEPLDAGGDAPLLSLRSLDGKRWDLSLYAGKPMVVNFWGSWCPPCLAELPDLVKTAEAYKNDVVFVGAAVNSPPGEIVSMVKKFGIEYPVAQTNHPSVARWRAEMLPSTYVLDAKHNVVWSTQGTVTEKKLAGVFEKHLQIPAK